MARVLLLMTLVGLALISHDSGPTYRASTRTTTRFVESKGHLQGEIWLGWGSNARVQFVRGFLTGYDDGWHGACGNSFTGNREQLESCQAAAQPFHRVSDAFYTNYLTQFYLSYPEDRDIPMRMLIHFADDESAEQVHVWVTSQDKPSSLFH
jgi:hypothetical protein